ncbi:TrmH family RNA methyltransferase [Halopolyspora algeriensis]|nr:RNA methyltransferase [Halopolyspora algeriensis]
MSGVARLIEVTAVEDPRVDDFRDLSTADRRPDRPGGRGLVIAEGVVVVRRMLASPYPIRALLGVRRRIEELGDEIADLDVPAYIADAEVMAGIVGFHLNRGVLAIADRAPEVELTRLTATARRLAVLEGIGDHENLGSLFRNAAAFGIDGVLLGAGCSDPLYRRSVRVSMGHVLRVPFTRVHSWPGDLKLLRDEGFRIVALSPRASSVPLREAEPGREPVAILLGSEGPGLTEQAMTAADVTVRIPMAGEVDSLNVATSAAIVFHIMGEGSEGGGR